MGHQRNAGTDPILRAPGTERHQVGCCVGAILADAEEVECPRPGEATGLTSSPAAPLNGGTDAGCNGDAPGR